MGRKRGSLPELEIVAAVRDGEGRARYLTSEMWQLCASEKQVLARPDEDVLWVTDMDSLSDELHHRTGGSDLYTFVEKDQYESAVYVKTVPKWVGPLDVKLFTKFLEKYPSACIQVKPSDDGVIRDKNWQAVRQFVRKLKNLPLWENYEERDSAGSVFLDHTPGAGEVRRTRKASREAEARRWKKIQQKNREVKNRYKIDIPVKDLKSLATALHREVGRQLPKKVLPQHPNFRRPWREWSEGGCDHASKAKIIERIIFCGGLLRLLDSPHHHELADGNLLPLRKALEKLMPRIQELKSKVLPFSDLGRYLSEEARLLPSLGDP